MLVDSHCHLDFPDFAETLDDVVKHAENADIGTIVTISTRVRQFEKIHAIAMRYGNVFCTIGTHPHNAGEERDVPLDDILALARRDKVVGIGEAGLDYYYDKSPRADQQAGFRRHIAAARETGLPLVIHARDADDDVAAILREEMGNGAFKAVLHCFSSGIALAETGLELGLYVSFSGILTFKNAKSVHDVAKMAPLDRIFVETDAPYLAPTPHRGKRNEPAFVRHTAAFLAELRGEEMETIERATTDNFFRLFDRATRPARANAA